MPACNDDNGCTTDTCDHGLCLHAAPTRRSSDLTAADCGDGTACTTDICAANGVCEHQPQAGCTPCTAAADCNDQDPCTTDACGTDEIGRAHVLTPVT